MDQNLPIMTKKLWNMVRFAFFMLKKGISKKNLLLDLNLMMKRAKIIAGKGGSSTRADVVCPSPSHLMYAASDDPREYEFSCNTTPLYRQFFTNKRKNNQNYDHYMISSLASFEETNRNDLESVNQVLETMLLSNKNRGVKQLRITDSPFSFQNDEDDDKCCDNQHVVDEAADDFIKKFYSQLIKEQIAS